MRIRKWETKYMLTLNREGKNVNVPVTLEERPSGSPRLISAHSSQEQEQEKREI